MEDAMQRVPHDLTDGESPGEGKSVGRSILVNRLNYLNFQNQHILVSLKHLVYDDTVFLKARPLPCAGERLDCLWDEIPSLKELLKSYRFDCLLVADGKKYLVVNSEVLSCDDCGLSLLLPPACREFHLRRIRRHPASGISGQLSQHGVLFDCALIDFTPVSLRVSGMWRRPETLHWINPEEPVQLRLFRGDALLYSGAFDIHSVRSVEECCTFVLRQRHNSIRRFKVKKHRNHRQELVPSPNAVFDHPLIDRRINLKVADLSGSGISLLESEGDSVLMPGMMIPGLRIGFAQGFTLKCLAQVLSRNPTGEEGENTVRCGLAILDMEIQDHVRFLSMLHQAEHRNAYVCTEVDLDELWDFFFETGFVYPGKYAFFERNKESIKKTYAKLYTENPRIARHFIYLEHGAILGHMAMVRFYRYSWLIHHHAARKTAAKAGLAVLEQVGHYLSELESYAFARLRYVFCYYRPDNRFPARVFGGFAQRHGDSATCSLDRFAYFHYRACRGDAALPPDWELVPSSDFDLTELGNFYRYLSGGAMIEAFDLFPGSHQEELKKEYGNLGFFKEVDRYSLRKQGSLKAFFLVNRTDAGFNMAELTNCVTLIVIDQTVPRPLLELALERVSRLYGGEGMPVLVFPSSYAEKEALPVEKTYLLWILDMQQSDRFMQYCDELLKGHKTR